MTIAFTKVGLPFGWLGNMSAFAIEHEGRRWPTAEHLFQALRFSDEEIRGNNSPMGAKFTARKHKDKMTVVPQSVADLRNMLMVLRLKLAQHPKLVKQLKETGDALIVEDCTKRQRGSGLFWGAAWDGKQWKGRNVLGRMWMHLRLLN